MSTVITSSTPESPLLYESSQNKSLGSRFKNKTGVWQPLEKGGDLGLREGEEPSSLGSAQSSHPAQLMGTASFSPGVLWTLWAVSRNVPSIVGIFTTLGLAP